MSPRFNQLAAVLVLAGCANFAQAAGFALVEQNASGLGNAYAGQAASAQDASTVFFNPAGMTMLPDAQWVVVGNLIKPSAKFSGTGDPVVGLGDGGDAGDLALAPNFYYAFRLTPDVHLGVGVNAPFGLKTEYDAGWIGRTQAIKSKIETVNINPSIAWRASETLSIGAGLNFQTIQAELTKFAGALGTAIVKGDDHGWGFNLGALWQPTPATRVGLAYRSEVDYTLEGKATFTGNALANSDITADATMPATASLSLFQRLSPQFDLLADVTWTGWSAFDVLRIVRTNGTELDKTTENWDNNLRYSLGMNYHPSDAWSFRGGVAYDETPVSDAYRTPRIPDESRLWVAAGGQYRMSRHGAIDFGYAHLFVDDARLNSSGGGTMLSGEYASHVDIVSVQYTHSF